MYYEFSVKIVCISLLLFMVFGGEIIFELYVFSTFFDN